MNLTIAAVLAATITKLSFQVAGDGWMDVNAIVRNDEARPSRWSSMTCKGFDRAGLVITVASTSVGELDPGESQQLHAISKPLGRVARITCKVRP